MAPPPRQDRAAQKIERDIRRRKATELAVAGHTYEEIAEKLGYNSRQAAHKDVSAGLAPAAKAAREAAETLIGVQLARLEEAHRVALEVLREYGAKGPDGRPIDEYSDKADQRLAAIDKVVKVSESVRKLFGLDQPAKTESKVEMSGTVGYELAVTPDELEQL